MKNGKYILTKEAIQLAKEKGIVYHPRKLQRLLKSKKIDNYFEGYRYFINKEHFLNHLNSLGCRYKEKIKNGRK
jgi:hypothetical protein